MIDSTTWPSTPAKISIQQAADPSDECGRATEPVSVEPFSVDTDDWVMLFHAAIARLERIAALSPDRTPAFDPLGTAVDLRVGVLDCAGALRQLHTMFVHDIGRQHRRLIEQVRPRVKVEGRRQRYDRVDRSL